MRCRAPRGARDLLPDEVLEHEGVERAARDLFRTAGYREIRPPLFEETALFARSIGEATDIVEKEMFTVVREGDSYTFRPEGTAGVVRAYLEASLPKDRPLRKFFYVGPMFRYERPQKGRERQFDQVGIEALGSLDPLLDAEAIHLAASFFERVGLPEVEVRINSMGDGADRDSYREKLRAFVAARLEEYCETCRSRFERNVFRVLDCKNERCRAISSKAPAILDSLSPENLRHFESVRRGLDAVGRKAAIDPQIVRGFDYYTRTVFEVHLPSLGARSALCGGGRYDHLIEELGGPSLGAVGFAIGVSPTLLAVRERAGTPPGPARELDLFVACAGEETREAAFALVDRVRREGIASDLDHEGKSLKGQLRLANRLGARALLVLGGEEVARGRGRLRDLSKGEEVEVDLADAAGIARRAREAAAPS
ncbi:MAG TPA: histidine--tRNA ligase [Planctomycetota bacterium]|jgi:histidyl-tRNA synthetase|nr:histidine--tRNA ligase [Planctomycetota bacterium]